MGDVKSPGNALQSHLLKQSSNSRILPLTSETPLYSQIRHLAGTGFMVVDKERNPADLLHRQVMRQGKQATVSGAFYVAVRKKRGFQASVVIRNVF